VRVVFLGTSGGIPTPRRSLPAVAVLREGEMILFDCGEGAQTQVMRRGLGFGRLTKIFITHLHGDHLSGLMGLMMTLSLLERRQPVDIYGPPELVPFFDSLKKDIGLHTRFDINLHPTGSGVFLREKEYHIEGARVPHRAPCFAFALQEGVRPGRFDLEKARELGIPEGPLFGKLQRGETIELEDGRTVTPGQVLGPPRPGRRLAYVTDTAYNPDIVPFCRGADLLIHESMFGSDMEEEARMRSHTTAAQAATIARDAGVRRLVLTHISARYMDPEPLVEEARKIFPETEVARDLMELEVPFRE